MISYICFVLASICNAVMDVSLFHYHKSIFKRFNNRLWWDGTISWQNKYIDGDFKKGRVKWSFLSIKFNKPVQLTDAFHFFKMLMIIFLSLSVITFDKSWLFKDLNILFYMINCLIYGTLWNVSFSLFYGDLLKERFSDI